VNRTVSVKGKNGISATVICDSVGGPFGKRMTTFVFEFPRWILAECNTHKILSKGASSSRAIPIQTAIEAVVAHPAIPIHFGKNNPGMSSKKELEGLELEAAKKIWQEAIDSALNIARVASDKMGIDGHKQWVNRIFENYTFTKQVISGTEWSNFFWLRNHPDAQPEFRELARCAQEAYQLSVPQRLNPGQWHLPFVATKETKNEFGLPEYAYLAENGSEIDLDTAKMISVSCCAQVSYRKLDDTLEKAKKIFDMLHIGSETDPSHSSPLEHQATPIGHHVFVQNTLHWEQGVTHMDRDGRLWSANLCGWIQNRKLYPNEARWD
jgi:Thymidylate synthase complementing protein